MRTRLALAATIATAAAAALMAPAGASASPRFPPCDPGCTIVVDSTLDQPDLNPGDGRCRSAAGRCTLRAAVQEANARRNKPPFQSEILVNPGTYHLTRHGLDDTASLGDLDLYFTGEIIGAGQARTIIDGDGADRVFDLHSSFERVAHLTVRGGRATDGPGGGIRATSVDYLEYLNVHDNVAVPGEAQDSGLGGGIAATESLIQFSTIAYNSAQDGAGVWFHGLQSPISADLILHNHATRDGGGLFFSAEDAFFSNLTISGNTAGAHGGGLYLAVPGAKSLDAAATTIASNTAPEGGGGGIWRATATDGRQKASGLVVGGNGTEDCAGPGTLLSTGSNVDSDGTCHFNLDTDHSGVDPMLGPVADNGGPTATRALRPGSPAIDAWSCTGMDFNEPSIDQRGAARPQGRTCDAGAFEVGTCCPPFEPAYVPGSVPDPNNPGPPTGACGKIIQGTNGPDTMVGDSHRNELHGRGGNDRIFGKKNGDCLFGGSGNDLVEGGDGADQIFGGSGNDHLSGGKGEDIIFGGSGNDRIYGGQDDDKLYGGSGNDYIKGGGGYDTITGGPGNDFIDATGKGLAKVDCGSGNDTVIAKRLEHIYRCEHIRYVD
jgi:CSLREA domain-containing protein